jgi:small-conductance mechanosensitive channel
VLEQINIWLDAHLTNQYWRLGLIIASALVVALVLRVFLLPLFYRLTRKSDSDIDDRVVDLLVPSVIRTVILQGIHVAVLDFVQDARIDRLATSVTTTLMILIWGRFFSLSVNIIFKRLSRDADKYPWIQPQTLPLVMFASKVFLFGVITYLLMSAWHVNLTSWLASAGVLGIAIGFAAKDTLANFISAPVDPGQRRGHRAQRRDRQRQDRQ